MHDIILGSLIHQAKGTELLCTLLREEHSLLRSGEPDKVAGLEMAIQELIRQLVREREFLVARLQLAGLARLGDLMETLGDGDRKIFETWRAKVIAHEQESGRQATVNADLAMALWKQSGQLLKHFQNQVAPRERNTYTASGRWHDRTSTATLVRGRM